jgi:hypothetical protein
MQTPLRFFSRSNFTNQRIFFDNFNGKLLTGDDSCNLFLFDIETKKCLAQAKFNQIVNDVCFDSDNTAIICLGSRGFNFSNEEGESLDDFDELNILALDVKRSSSVKISFSEAEVREIKFDLMTFAITEI